MHTPLRYQVTEYDCGTTTLINALSYLFERENIPVTLIKNIYKYTLDEEGNSGVIGEGGTSENAIKTMTHWITAFANSHEFGIKAELSIGSNVTIKSIRQCIKNGGCVVARCYQQSEHYVLITDIDKDFVYIWDPYYLEDDYYRDDDFVDIIYHSTYNRMVRTARLIGQSKKDFSLMEKEKREILLLQKIN